jgi:hypothetical protein
MYKAFGVGDLGSIRRLLFWCGTGRMRRVTVRLGLGHAGPLRVMPSGLAGGRWCAEKG